MTNTIINTIFDITGTAGRDTLGGGANHEVINGGGGNDTINGGSGVNEIFGNDGDDTIITGEYASSETGGMNSLTGGAGNDTFIIKTLAFNNKGGRLDKGDDSIVVIKDFAQGDKIDITAFSTINNFSQIKIGSTLDPAVQRDLQREFLLGQNNSLFKNSNTVIELGEHHRIILSNINPSMLSADSFVIHTDTPITPTVNGTEGNDTALSTTDNAEVINGNGGDDTINGKGGNDTINGGAGNDTINGGEGNDAINPGAGTNTVVTSAGYDVIYTEEGTDTIQVNVIPGSHTIIDGDATVDLSAFPQYRDVTDVLDSLVWTAQQNQPSSAGLDVGGGQLVLFRGVNEPLDIVSNIRFVFAGSSATVEGSALNGGDGADVLNGTTSNDTINGGKGDDVIDGKGGNDVINGNEGNDTVTGGAGNDTITAADGNDRVLTSAGNDVINLGNVVPNRGVSEPAPHATIVVNAAANAVTELTGTNSATIDLAQFTAIKGETHLREHFSVVAGRAPLDPMVKLDLGNDQQVLFHAASIDAVLAHHSFVLANDPNYQEGWGNNADTLNGTVNADTLIGNAGNDVIRGNGGSDVIDGGADNDTIYGGIGNDTITPGAGNDIIHTSGGLADQILLNNAGNDTLVIERNPASHTIVTGLSNDTIDLSAITEIANLQALVSTALLQDGVKTDNAGAVEYYYTLLTLPNTQIIEFRGVNSLEFLANNQFVFYGPTPTVPGSNPEVVNGTDQADNDAYWTANGVNGDAEQINGLGGNDTIDGKDGNDSINGGDGDDVIITSGGNNSVTLGGGADTIRVVTAANSGQVVADFVRGTDKVDVSGLGITNFSQLTIQAVARATDLGMVSDMQKITFANNQTVTLQNNAQALTAGDFIFATTNPTVPGGVATIEGTESADDATYWAARVTDSAEVILGKGGDDTIDGKGGNDTIDGGDGNDFVNGGAGNDSIIGGAGNDALVTSAGLDKAVLGAGADLIEVRAAANADLSVSDFTPGTDKMDIKALGITAFSQINIQSVTRTTTSGVSTDVRQIILPDGQTITLENNVQLTASDFIFATAPEVPVNTITGTAGDDSTLTTGTEGPDLINALAGNDTVTGLGGNDTIDGGTGNDSIDAGAGDDTVFFDSADVFVTGGAGNDTVSGVTGNVTLDGAVFQGFETLTLSDNNVALTVANAYTTAGAGVTGLTVNATALTAGHALTLNTSALTSVGVTVQGGANSDTITLGNGNNSVFGRDGNDTVTGGSGSDQIYGHAGNDSLDGGGGGDVLFGQEGNDTLNGGDGNDSLFGQEGGDDVLIGGNSDDTLVAGEGNDMLTGGEGSDTFRLITALANPTEVKISLITDFNVDPNVDEKLDLKAFRDLKSLDDAGVTVTNVTAAQGFTFNGQTYNQAAVIIDLTQINNQKLIVAAAPGQDITADTLKDRILFASNNDGGNGSAPSGGATDGPDNITGTGGDETINGGDGNDVLTGLGGKDVLAGGNGDDLVNGGEGDDTLSGDAGKDTINGGEGDDLMEGGEGNDVLNGDAGKDTIFGGAGDDSIDGGEGDDLLRGGEGNDFINGGDGNNVIGGGVGNDTLFGGAGNDFVQGNDGVDSVYGGEGSDTVRGGQGSDALLQGNMGDDVIFGDAGDDFLRGGKGNDTIYGGDGNDILMGDMGQNTLYGGEGADTFYVQRDIDVIGDLQSIDAVIYY